MLGYRHNSPYRHWPVLATRWRVRVRWLDPFSTGEQAAIHGQPYGVIDSDSAGDSLEHAEVHRTLRARSRSACAAP